jgi:hypothetical protein
MGFFKKAKSFVTGAGGGTSLLGTVAGAALGGAGSYFAAKQAQRAQKEFYKNRHQWEVADLRKAGLNPILSATQGPGSAPAVAQANIAGGIQSGLNSARQAKMINAELEAVESQADRDKSQALTNEWIANNQQWQAHLNYLQGDYVKQQTANAKEMGRRIGLENKIYARDATVADFERELYEKYPMIIGAEMLNRNVSGLNIFRGMFRGNRKRTTTKSNYDQYGVFRGGSTTTSGF